MTTDMPTPESLEAEAAELETKAATKERIAAQSWVTPASAALLLKDAGYFKEEAASKKERAKAARLAAK